MAQPVADRAVREADTVSRSDLVERFSRIGPAVVANLRGADPDRLVPWPAAEGVLPLTEALRIMLMEAAVHLLDVQRALSEEPAIPAGALRETVRLLGEIPDPVDLIEAATGRSELSPLPLLR
jgi:hypothetical protein